MAAGLAGMVASMSRGKKAYLQYESQLSEAIARLTPLREELKSAIDVDAESYNVVMKAYKAAKESLPAAETCNQRRAPSRRPACLWVWPKERLKWRGSPATEADHQPQHEFRSDHRDRPGKRRYRRSARQRCDQSRFNQAQFA